MFQKDWPNHVGSASSNQTQIDELTNTLKTHIAQCTNPNNNTTFGELGNTIDYLKELPFGLQVLHVIGYSYASKAKDFLSNRSVTKRVFSKLKSGLSHKTESQKNHELAASTLAELKKTIAKLQTSLEKEESQRATLTPRQLEIHIQGQKDLEYWVLVCFLKIVWLGLQSEIQAVLDKVCDTLLQPFVDEKRGKSSQKTADDLGLFGMQLRKTFQRLSRRRISVFYWDVCMHMGADIYAQDTRYALVPNKVTANNGQRLAPDGPQYEYVNYGVPYPKLPRGSGSNGQRLAPGRPQYEYMNYGVPYPKFHRGSRITPGMGFVGAAGGIGLWGLGNGYYSSTDIYNDDGNRCCDDGNGHCHNGNGYCDNGNGPGYCDNGNGPGFFDSGNSGCDSGGGFWSGFFSGDGGGFSFGGDGGGGFGGGCDTSGGCSTSFN